MRFGEDVGSHNRPGNGLGYLVTTTIQDRLLYHTSIKTLSIMIVRIMLLNIKLNNVKLGIKRMKLQESLDKGSKMPQHSAWWTLQ